ncbi:hypothetical protein ACEPAH_8927 [Sanghuangporus vaninii]
MESLFPPRIDVLAGPAHLGDDLRRVCGAALGLHALVCTAMSLRDGSVFEELCVPLGTDSFVYVDGAYKERAEVEAVKEVGGGFAN